MVDDLRLALERSGVAMPRADLVPTFGAPGGLLDVGGLMTPASEVVVENPVDGRAGGGRGRRHPALAARPPVAACPRRARPGRLRRRAGRGRATRGLAGAWARPRHPCPRPEEPPLR